MPHFKKTLKDIEVQNKRVIMRVDFNVPMNGTTITNDERIKATLPTLYNLIGRKAKIILISHLGRPENKEEEFSLKPIAAHLTKLLDCKDIPVLDVNGTDTKSTIDSMKDGDVVLLENIRFYEEEEKNFRDFAKHLASFGDVFINDAFAVSHRTHASVVGIPDHLPSAAGLLLEQEIKFLRFFLQRPAKPIVTIIGGKKVSTKVAVLDAYLDKADTILLAGGAANTFLKAWGDDIGNSFYEESMIDTCKELIWKAARCHTALVMPTDAVITDAFNNPNSSFDTVMTASITPGTMIADIGPRTVDRFTDIIRHAGTVIWSGPLGVTEDPRFRTGNDAILKAIAQAGINSVVGGGDTLAAIAGRPGAEHITHASTGGGATLEFIEKGTLPGIQVLEDRK